MIEKMIEITAITYHQHAAIYYSTNNLLKRRLILTSAEKTQIVISLILQCNGQNTDRLREGRGGGTQSD